MQEEHLDGKCSAKPEYKKYQVHVCCCFLAFNGYAILDLQFIVTHALQGRYSLPFACLVQDIQCLEA